MQKKSLNLAHTDIYYIQNSKFKIRKNIYQRTDRRTYHIGLYYLSIKDFTLNRSLKGDNEVSKHTFVLVVQSNGIWAVMGDVCVCYGITRPEDKSIFIFYHIRGYQMDIMPITCDIRCLCIGYWIFGRFFLVKTIYYPSNESIHCTYTKRIINYKLYSMKMTIKGCVENCVFILQLHFVTSHPLKS